ncbi:hypothetical protein Q669_27910 [Labrenzia sp. C1B10]|nr:hypothetical protein Q669_27910 [Labrenzia sp. C1B10]ERS03543.1 hypothetical protein Q675_31215 [Labrenzia sp. C1B70]
MTLGHDAVYHHGNLDIKLVENVENPEYSAAGPVVGESNGVKIGEAGLERIAHRADTGPAVVRPALESASKEQCQPFASWPPEIIR